MYMYMYLVTPLWENVYRYTSQTIQVHVTSDEAVEVNFTLSRNELDQWSQREDFQLLENLKREYRSNLDLLSDMKSIAQSHSDVMEVQELPRSLKRSTSPNPDPVYLVHLSTNLSKHEDEKPHVLLIGGFSNNKSPVGAQILTYFIRHQIKGELSSI